MSGFADYFLGGMQQGAGMWSEDQALARQSRMDQIAQEDRRIAEEQRLFSNQNITADNERAAGRYAMDQQAFGDQRAERQRELLDRKTRVEFWAAQARANLGRTGGGMGAAGAPGMGMDLAGPPREAMNDPMMQGPQQQAPPAMELQGPPQQGAGGGMGGGGMGGMGAGGAPGMGMDQDAAQMEAMIQMAEQGNDEDGLKAIVAASGSPFMRAQQMSLARQVLETVGDNDNVIKDKTLRGLVRTLAQLNKPEAAMELMSQVLIQQAEKEATDKAAMGLAVGAGVDPELAKSLGVEAMQRLTLALQMPGETMAQRLAKIEAVMTSTGMDRKTAAGYVDARAQNLVGLAQPSSGGGTGRANPDTTERLKLQLKDAEQQLMSLNKGKMPAFPSAEDLADMAEDEPDKHRAFLELRKARRALDQHLTTGERPQAPDQGSSPTPSPSYNGATTTVDAGGAAPTASGSQALDTSAEPGAPDSSPFDLANLSSKFDAGMTDEQIRDEIVARLDGPAGAQHVTGTNPADPGADEDRER